MLARVGDWGCVRSANERRYTTRTQHDHSCTAPRSSHVDCVGKSALVSSGCNKRGLKHPNNSDVEPLTCLISELQALHFKHSNMETPGMITIHPFRFFGYNTWVTKKKNCFRAIPRKLLPELRVAAVLLCHPRKTYVRLCTCIMSPMWASPHSCLLYTSPSPRD